MADARLQYRVPIRRRASRETSGLRRHEAQLNELSFLRIYSDKYGVADNLAQLNQSMAKDVADRRMFKTDRDAAYKKFPTDPAGQANAAISLRRPKSGNWFGIVTRTLVFGAVADVIL